MSQLDDARSTYLAIIPHVTKPQLALLFEDDHWRLPMWTTTARYSWPTVAHVNEAVRERFGLSVTTLRCLGVRFDDATGDRATIYEFESRSPAWSPPGRGRWVGRDAVDVLPFAEERERAVARAWFAAADSPRPARRPWARRGWFDATTNWIRDQLRLRGVTMESATQLRTWERSCVLRVMTDSGALYFKAVPQLFAHEPVLTRALSQWFPQHMPRLVALDDARHWMLLHDLGGVALDECADLARWEAALRAYAQTQINLALRRPDLLALGVPERPLADLPGQVAALLDDDAALGLTAPEADRLRALARDVPERVAALLDLAIPASLEHGDLHPGNVIATDDGGSVFFDWSDAGVAHPFFGPALFLAGDDQPFVADDAARDRLRAAYLEPWSLFRPADELRTAFALATALAPLHHAVVYHREILPALEQRWEMEAMIPFYLRLALAAPGSPGPA